MDRQITEHYGRLPGECWEEFAHFSANLQHILGIPFSVRHFQEYTACRTYAKMQAGLDLRAGITLPFADRDLARLATGRPAMFVSFHFGSYRSVPLRILALGRSVCVVLSREVLAKYSRYYSSLLVDPGDPDGPPGLLLVEAEDPSLFFKLRSATRRGMHAFVYADGARGAKVGAKEKEKLISVELLKGRLGAMSGYLDFAHLLGLGVHLLLDSALQPQLGFQGKQLLTRSLPWHSDRKRFAESSLVEIFRCFGRSLCKFPHIWESLLYLHRQGVPTSALAGWKAEDRLVPLDPTMHWGLDRYTYRRYVVGDPASFGW
jgi:hypothetical protein